MININASEGVTEIMEMAGEFMAEVWPIFALAIGLPLTFLIIYWIMLFFAEEKKREKELNKKISKARKENRKLLKELDNLL